MITYILYLTGLFLTSESADGKVSRFQYHIKSINKFCKLFLILLSCFSCVKTISANVTYTWTGTSNSNWSDSTNWSPVAPSGGPNGCSADVIIPATTYAPVVTSSVWAGNVTINDHAILTLKAALVICRNLNGGTLAYATIAGRGTVIFTSDSAQYITGMIQMRELYLDNAAGLTMQPGSVLDIYTALDLKTGNFNASAGALTFKSNSADSIAIVDNFSEGNYTGYVTGNVTVERYYNASSTYNQHFIGSPVNNPSLAQFGASGTPGFVQNPTCDETHSAPTSPYGTIFGLNESNGTACAMQQWQVLTNGNAQNESGYSFLSHGAGTLVLNGTLNLDTIYSVGGLTNSGWTNTSLQGRTYNSGWHLVSNPYLAQLELTQTPAGFDNQIQIWNANGPYAGTYQPANIGTDAFVAPFQAFMVHKTTPGGNSVYNINGNQRIREVHTFYLQNANRLNIVATNLSNGLLDQTSISFNSAATNGFDSQLDAVKIPGVLNRHTIYTTAGGTWMSRNVLHDINVVNTIPLGFEPGADGSYSFSFNGLNTFDPTVGIYLEDKVTRTLFNLRNGSYTFTADSNEDWNRFVLHLNPALQISVVNAACAGTGSIILSQPGSVSWNFTLTDSNDIMVANGIIKADNADTITVEAGTYTLTLVEGDGYSVTKTVTIDGGDGARPIAAFQITTGNSLVATSEAETDEPVMLNATVNGPPQDIYQWNFGNGTTGSNGEASVVYKAAGNYLITLLVENAEGCSATSAQTITITDAPADIKEASIAGAPYIWSNSNIVYVDFGRIPEINATVTIYDILGRQISSDHSTQLLYEKQIDNIEVGCFIVAVSNNEKVTAKKIFIGNIK